MCKSYSKNPRSSRRSNPGHGGGEAVPDYDAGRPQRRRYPRRPEALAANRRTEWQPLRRANGNGENLLPRSDYERAV